MLPPRAYIFLGLNAIRILSLIALVLVFASNIVVLVHDIQAVNRFVKGGNTTIEENVDCTYIDGSTVPNQPAGAFWAVLNRILILVQVIVLLFSELGWPGKLFNRFFPVLGSDFGLGALGIMQSLISAAILSHHVDDFALVAAFFLFAIACINMLLGLIFRQGAKTKRSIFAWREHAKSAIPKKVTNVLPTHVQDMAADAASDLASRIFGGNKAGDKDQKSNAPSFMSKNYIGESEKTAAQAPPKGFGFGRQGEKAAGLKGFLISKPMESVSRFAATPSAGAKF